MIGRLNVRRAGCHLIDAWATRQVLSRATAFRNDVHTQTNKRTCLVSKRPCLHSRKTINHNARSLFTESIPPLLFPPAIFTGLLLGLWTWKCFWIIVMQNKLLYLSWLPPFSRSDKIDDYLSECKPVQWEEKRIRSSDGTELAVCEGRIPAKENTKPIESRKKKSVVICYFQGNGGSTPLRLPLLSQILRALANKSKSATPNDDTEYTIVALSYRGYWTSSGRATQNGIETDAQSFLDWVSSSYARPDVDLKIVLWGHSLGSAVASSVLSKYLGAQATTHQVHNGEKLPPISGMVMEAPISNIKDMLISLYPQKWLPYRYLWPFSWNTWCTATNLERLSSAKSHTTPEKENDQTNHLNVAQSPSVPPILIFSAENDEVIPLHVAGQLERKGQELGLDIVRKEVPGAMHIECPMKQYGREALVEFIRNKTL